MTMAFSTVDLTPRIGTEIKSNKKSLLSGEHASKIRDVLEQRGIVLFRELNLNNDEQMIFTRSLGKPMPQLGHEVMDVSLDEKHNGALAEYLKGAFYWHIDTATEDVPTRASLLTARVLSPIGGDTQFANTYAAWDDLPESEKKDLMKVRVVHSFEVSQRYVKPEPSYEELKAWTSLKQPHPLVWTHKSGRKSLVLGSTASHVEGMSMEEGHLLLARLRDWATQPQFVYQHKWTIGDMIIWR